MTGDPSRLTFEQFVQRLLQLLDEGRFVATYKLAVLLALLDVVAENVDDLGAAPATVSTHDLARKVVEVYWTHTRAYPHATEPGDVVLRQNQAGQAQILTFISRFRTSTVGDQAAPLSRARSSDPVRFEALVRDVEFKLIEMPLGRLQLIGNDDDRFIYELPWTTAPPTRVVSRDDFDGRLHLRWGARDHLLRASPLLRPLIERTWA